VKTLSLPQAQGTSIEWTHRPGTKGETWTAGVFGCSKVSSGCTNCYAMRMAARQAWMARKARENGRPVSPAQAAYERVVARKRNGDPKPQWNNKIVLVPEALREPMRWRDPRTVFVSSMSDLFHELVPHDHLDHAYAVMALTPRHLYLPLTKRPDRMAEYANQSGFTMRIAQKVRGFLGRRKVTDPVRTQVVIDEIDWNDGILANVTPGTSVESADHLERMDHLAAVPAVGYFVSFEPIVGDLGDIRPGLRALVDAAGGNPRRVQAIFGGESGPGARALDLSVLRRANDMAREVGVAVFNKQLGANPYIDHSPEPAATLARKHGIGPLVAEFLVLRDRKGGDMGEWPEWAQVREFPEVPGFTTASKEAKR